MPENGHRHTAQNTQGFAGRSRTTTRRVERVSPSRLGKWLWVTGMFTMVASIAVILVGLQPSAFHIFATFALLLSTGLLAAVSATRALDFGARYEESIHYIEEVERSYQSLRQVVSTTIDTHDHRVSGRSDHVVSLALELGQRLGLAPDRLRHLEWAAFLHDIGKVRLDEELLTKPGPLSSGEWGEMQQHPYHSYAILTQVDHLREAAEIVYSHHERFDGTGYPRRLKEAEIPMEARVFAVADAYDAMTSDRPYRRALSHEEAVREIVAQSGSQFDAAVVAVFVQWALSVGGEATRQAVEEGVTSLPTGLPQLDRAHWAYPK